MDDRLFNFEKLIANMPGIANRIDRIIGNYKPETETEYEDKKRGFISILNADKSSVLDFYLNRENFWAD